jgi:hypothetical protein
MKKLLPVLLVLSIPFFFTTCDTTESNDDPNSLGGDPDLTLGQVGNTFETGSLRIGNNSYDINGVFEVTNNNSGVVDIKVNADLSQVPALAAFNDFIPASMKDANGKINCNVQFKVTTEGMQDNLNVDGKLHTLVKYNAKVGDQYQLKTSNGKTITRQVTERTDQDDFPYGLMLIKTIKVEQDSRIPGISKFIFRLNHKFGLVYVEIVMEDGTSAYIYLY